ncbi:hypothetical protein L596_002660 [Steinernema carpocapsae]|uniref:Anaphase-promoting complex subunit 11 n=1 Tax=Steinernema carpocapsae TaxID=34508 RepID=A0A4U8UQE0_STECR|nr:hypothetical protein L596_002660 [Steinernema carpocapsae]
MHADYVHPCSANGEQTASGTSYLRHSSELCQLHKTRNSPERRRSQTRISRLSCLRTLTWKISVKRYVGFAEWKWIKQTTDDNCGICLQVFEACCVECKLPGDKCPLVEGRCKHSFHVHCINKWIRTHGGGRGQCPLCRQEWMAPPTPIPMANMTTP